MNIDYKKLEDLLAQKRLQEAGEIIKAAVAEPLTEAEKGAAYTGAASAYLDIMNSINVQYRDALQEAIEAIKKLNKAESGFKDKIAVAEIKEKLNITK
jgi:hypothetical protein